jgi:signal-transduction protein with cAMP-binding, CBS, and nucleotidyltransferase domain
MHQRAVGTLVVVNDAAQVVGIVTDRDLMSRVLARGRHPAATSVGQIMTVSPKTVSEETSIESALLIMRSGRFRRIPVVERDNKLVGLITMDDILMLLAEEFTQIGRLLTRETPRAIVESSTQAGVARLQSEARLSIGD